MKALLALSQVAFALTLGVLAALAVLVLWAAIERALGREYCPSDSTPHGQGFDARPAGIACLRRAGHTGDHQGRDAVTGKLWRWNE